MQPVQAESSPWTVLWTALGYWFLEMNLLHLYVFVMDGLLSAKLRSIADDARCRTVLHWMTSLTL